MMVRVYETNFESLCQQFHDMWYFEKLPSWPDATNSSSRVTVKHHVCFV